MAKLFDVIKSVSLEYMHLAYWVYLSQKSSFDLSQSNMAEIERRFKNIEVPSEIHREPRGLNEMKHWKGTWFTYICVHDFNVYFCFSIGIQNMDIVLFFTRNAWHLGRRILAAFCEALWLLLQSVVSEDDIAKAERMLQHFCFKFSAFYGDSKVVYGKYSYLNCTHVGDRYCTANVHGLLHLADAVRNFGPLWAHSAFPFEGINGWLGDLYHGTREPQKQVCGFLSTVYTS